MNNNTYHYPKFESLTNNNPACPAGHCLKLIICSTIILIETMLEIDSYILDYHIVLSNLENILVCLRRLETIPV